MEDFAASMIAQTIGTALKDVGAIIKRQFMYLFCLSSNIIGLKDEAKKLDDAMQGVQAQVDEVMNNAREIHPDVTSWFGKSDKFISEMNIILNEVPNVEGGCLKLAARFSLSKRAKKTTEAMTQHREDSNFTNISLPPPAAATKEIPLGKTYAFDSRKKIEQEIMKTLRDNEENMIAIHGMGGLGKTTMATRIMNALLREKVFDEVVFAVVSRKVDELKLQLDIGGSLGLKNLKDKTEQARAQILHARLSADTKRVLIVLDDVWDKLVLEKLGIPCGSKGCTILITSRNSDTLREMDVKKLFEMEQLSEEDAWFMFREKAGTCMDDKKLRFTAKEVVRECRGLPVVLEAVGAALKDEKSKGVWKDTLKKMRKPNPKSTPYYIAEVYTPLIVSYDKLDEEVKSPFLLCCLFPEDVNISLEHLTYFCIGLRLFEDLESLEEARDRMCSLVKSLKSRSLLLDGRNEDYVRIHDVIRDVCVFIAKQKGYIGGNDCTWISFIQRQAPEIELSTGLRFPNLHLFFSNDEELNIENTIFEGMRELYVLSIENYSRTSLPHTTQALINLRTLLFDSCDNLETISVVGGLVHLEILICRSCDEIKELPQEIRGLKHLKLLELTKCKNLQSIGRGIISSLVELEELKMLGSFDRWEAAAEDGQINAGLRELESLTKLTCLEIQIADPASAAQEINLSSTLERYDIIFGEDYHDFPKGSNKNMVLRWDEGTCLGDWIEKLLMDTECLCLTGKGANNLDFRKYFPNIQWFKLGECGGIKSIATTSTNGGANLFPRMECLVLDDLPQLEEIWNGPISSTSFRNLKEIVIYNLPALKQLWKSSTIVSLPQLEILEISNCEMMEQLFLWSKEDESRTNSGSQNCDVAEIQGIEFPLLKRMCIEECPKMKSIIPTSLNGYGCNRNNLGSTSKADVGDHYSHLFCDQPEKVSFGGLKELLIEDDKEEGKDVFGGERSLLFPNLQELGLISLSKLVTFCKSDVELPSLKEVTIFWCPNMTNHSFERLALEMVKTDLYLEDLFTKNENPSCSLHNTRIFSFVNGLQMLFIRDYQGSTSILSFSIAENLINLTALLISECYEMVKVIEGGERSSTLLFPKLRMLQLKSLPKLEIFCECESDVEFPSLRILDIRDCPNMTKFSCGSVTAPWLTVVSVDIHKHYKRVDVSTDFNGVLQQFFAMEKEKAMKEGHEDEQSTSNEEKKGQEDLIK